jgi:putative FmdB family regulatory protein
MPIYEYRRPDGTTFEVLQKFSDDALTEDPETGVPVRRVLSAPAIHFKGKGFHNTDYGTKKRPVGGGSDSSSSDSSSSSSGSSDSSGSSSADSGTSASSSSSSDSSSSSGSSSSSDSGSGGGAASKPAPSAAKD